MPFPRWGPRPAHSGPDFYGDEFLGSCSLPVAPADGFG